MRLWQHAGSRRCPLSNHKAFFHHCLCHSSTFRRLPRRAHSLARTGQSLALARFTSCAADEPIPGVQTDQEYKRCLTDRRPRREPAEDEANASTIVRISHPWPCLLATLSRLVFVQMSPYLVFVTPDGETSKTESAEDAGESASWSEPVQLRGSGSPIKARAVPQSKVHTAIELVFARSIESSHI